MSLFAYGLNHRSAGIDLRGRISIPDDGIEEVLDSLRTSVDAIKEVVVLSTCNRTEVHCGVDGAGDLKSDLHHWFAEHRDVTLAEMQQTCYSYWGDSAAYHVMRVAAGLDSQVLGEPQILGQFKNAYRLADGSDAIGMELRALEGAAIRAAKRIRTETEIGKNTTSVAQAAVTMSKQIFEDMTDVKALLIGAGETICLVSQHLQSAGVNNVAIANRTLSAADALAGQIGGTSMSLDQMPDHVHEYDILVSSTASVETVVDAPTIIEACRRRRYRPLFVVDLAVPRDVDASVADIPNVYLYTIDDLSNVIEANLENRRQAAREAELHIDEEVKTLNRELRTRRSNEVLARFRSANQVARDEQIAKAVKRLQAGDDPTEVLTRFGHDLTNKLTHAPTVSIREASARDDTDLLRTLLKLFGAD